MKRVALALALAAIASAAPAQERDRPPGGMRRGYANPTAVIAAEIAFNRMAQTEGQWKAYRETVAPDAVMFAVDPLAAGQAMPRMVMAEQWLKGRRDTPAPLTWQPHAAWSSCDGSLTLTTGAFRAADGTGGSFTALWQRQTNGTYKWVYWDGIDGDPPATPDMIAARVAECSAARPPAPPSATKQRGKPAAPPFDPYAREGSSRDGTLRWRVTVDASGTRAFRAEMAQSGGMGTIREVTGREVTGG